MATKATVQTLLELVVKQHNEVIEKINDFELDMARRLSDHEGRIKALETSDNDDDESRQYWFRLFAGGAALAIISGVVGMILSRGL